MGISKSDSKKKKKSKNIVQSERQFRSGTGWRGTKDTSVLSGISPSGVVNKRKPYHSSNITKTPSDMPIVKPRGAPTKGSPRNIEGYRAGGDASDTKGVEYNKVINPMSKSGKKKKRSMLSKRGRNMA